MKIKSIRTGLGLALLSLVIAVAAIAGYSGVVDSPREQTLVNIESPSALYGAAPYNISGNPVRCKQSGVNCVAVWNGSDISLYSDAGATRTFLLDGATGNIVSSGAISTTGYITATAVSIAGTYVGITPVATATKINFATEAAGQSIAPTAVIINGTPVVPFATPQIANNLYCVFGSTTVTGTTTITNHGLTTPSYAIPWLAQTITGDAARVYSSISGITVTLGVMNSALTPVANATGAAVKYQICGTK